jgi:hypothetical protein
MTVCPETPDPGSAYFRRIALPGVPGGATMIRQVLTTTVWLVLLTTCTGAHVQEASSPEAVFEDLWQTFDRGYAAFDVRWRAYNGTGNNIDVAVQVALDPRNNVIVSGWSTGTHNTDVDFTTILYDQGGTEAVSPPVDGGQGAWCWSRRVRTRSTRRRRFGSASKRRVRSIFRCGTSRGEGSGPSAVAGSQAVSTIR